MFKEFKEFALKGNVMNLAVGVVIGAAFQNIVNSLVNDIIMPTISIITGKIDFSNMVFTFGNTSIKYGNFITAIVNFLIVSFSIFLVVKYINKINKIEKTRIKDLNDKLINKIDKTGKLKKYTNSEPEPPAGPQTKICPYCLSEVKYKATRCPYCTSELSDSTEEVESSS